MSKLKFSPGQFADCLKENDGPISLAKLAKLIGCSEPTARKYLKALRKEGLAVLPTRLGVLLAEKVTEKDIARLVKQSGDWQVGCLSALALIARVSKKPLKLALKKLLPEADRKAIRRTLAILMHAIDMLEIEEDFEPPKLEE